MSEEKKIVELQDEELIKVSGGENKNPIYKEFVYKRFDSNDDYGWANETPENIAKMSDKSSVLFLRGILHKDVVHLAIGGNAPLEFIRYHYDLNNPIEMDCEFLNGK